MPAQNVVKPAPATPGVFTLTDEHTQALLASPSRGRAAVANEYVGPALESADNGSEQKGISLPSTDTDKAAVKARNKLAAAKKFIDRTLDGEVILIESRLVKDHPKLGSFIVFSARKEPVKATEDNATA